MLWKGSLLLDLEKKRLQAESHDLVIGCRSRAHLRNNILILVSASKVPVQSYAAFHWLWKTLSWTCPKTTVCL